MPSSTSNSSQRQPNLQVRRLGLASLVCFGVLLGSVETIARARGYEPMVRDTKELWAYHRERASNEGQNSVVLIGASRIQNGMVPEVLTNQFPDRKVAMLALAGHDSFAMLENLANDETFTGTVICSTTILWIKGDYFNQTMTRFIEFHENEWSRRAQLSTNVHIHLQEHLAILHEGLSFEALRARLFGLRYGNISIARASRFREIHWANAQDIEKKRNRATAIYKDTLGEAPFPPPDDMVQHYLRVETTVQKLIQKGCRVIFVRMPSSGEVWTLEQQHTPKQLYWDRFAQETTAETIHFKDHPTLSGFECADNTHLDYSDAILFTRAFAELLIDNGDD